ncbi:UbiD family decarboxylase [Leptospira interrogans]|uniref:UbiD family decarboxylase n=3 Tax=Leptospira interrogans TaxID=173 RepID=A0AAP9WBC8_LEPIR|nr:UbiD family decarboxylase [Leptospira interrogans]EMF70180.1 UbiD family decarboxylase [Leptospira interrogans serovar Canicola str. LT1962]EMG10712.1 UbiD family decarboxylase [Leptospira interrogans serovar Grippotyphosa str. LT2186]EJP04089.1 UbiD family decarboxylase [Leptospira interrogans serovar Bulgarica str. Mallika]EKR43074.1 UbiD family decarboxylase [Leptospira interrogans serovar Grippotyphosa str. UI 08368]EMM89040.1 UbiD family decarboxylase [Leptospira interrogans serovar Dj
MKIKSTSEFVKELQIQNELLIIEEEVDPILELAEIQRRVVAKRGPAILFKNVKGSRFSVVTNLYGSERRMKIAFGEEPVRFIRKIATTIQHILPPTPAKIWDLRNIAFQALKVGLKRVGSAPVLENTLDSLYELPTLMSWPKDGGRFVTLPLVYTESPKTGKGNLGMYRIQIYGPMETGMHIQIHRGGGNHYYEAEKEGHFLPVHIYAGGPPALTIAAVAPLPEEISELILASLLLGEKLKIQKNTNVSPLPVVADADFLIQGVIPPKIRKPEGPFGDHYGYYALKHDYPIVQVKRIYHRKNAIWPATVVGRPPQEDHWIAEYLQDLLSPLFPVVMPAVKKVWAYEESGVHSLAAAVVKERYQGEAFTGALRILGEGQLSLTKVLLITDQDVDLKNFRETFITVLERMNPITDLHIFANISQDTLDYTGPAVNQGSKAIFLGSGKKKNDLKTQFKGKFSNSSFKNPKIPYPGTLVVSGPKYKLKDGVPAKLLKEKSIQDFLFVFLVDDSEDTIRSDHDFIWSVFTRFEPAGDIYANTKLIRNHPAFYPPIVVDCRMKTWYPPLTEADSKTIRKVDDRFGRLIDSL